MKLLSFESKAIYSHSLSKNFISEAYITRAVEYVYNDLVTIIKAL